jgi:hypothetical protein
MVQGAKILLDATIAEKVHRTSRARLPLNKGLADKTAPAPSWRQTDDCCCTEAVG